MATTIPLFPENVLDALGNSIGNSFSHRQLTDLFKRARVADEVDGARWLRVRDNLAAQQKRDGAANAVRWRGSGKLGR